MLYHKDCGNPVHMESHIVIISGISLTQDGIRLSGGKVKGIGDTKPAFVCACGAVIASHTNIAGRCMNCGAEKSTEELFVPQQTNGTYCRQCCTECYPEQRLVKLSTVLHKP
jgi:hypothetical protein